MTTTTITIIAGLLLALPLYLRWCAAMIAAGLRTPAGPPKPKRAKPVDPEAAFRDKLAAKFGEGPKPRRPVW